METSPAQQSFLSSTRTPSAQLLLPNVGLANCVFGAFVRDTRGCKLSSLQRFNHFAASPLCAISWVFEGVPHLLDDVGQMADPASAPQYPKIVFSGPQQHPLTSWNPGDTHAMVLGFYPEASTALAGFSPRDHLNKHVPVEEVLSGDFLDLVLAVHETDEALAGYQLMAEALEPLWQSARPAGPRFGHRVSDWAKSLAIRAMMSSAGSSTRQAQRRVKTWTGQIPTQSRFLRTDRQDISVRTCRKGERRPKLGRPVLPSRLRRSGTHGQTGSGANRIFARRLDETN